MEKSWILSVQKSGNPVLFMKDTTEILLVSVVNS